MTFIPSPERRRAADARAASLAHLPLREAGGDHGLLKGTLRSVTDVWAYRELLGLLVRREIKARYKDSTLGLFWSLVRPLAQLLIYYLAVGKFLGAQRVIPDYAIFVFTGLTAWQLFSEVISSGTSSIVANGGLVKKIYLPREVFPLSAIGSALFNFCIQLVVLVIATFVVGKPPGGIDLLYVPLCLASLLIWTTAAAFLLSALNVYLRDIQYLVEISLMVLFWTAPTVYSWKQVHDVLGGGWLGRLYDANPLVGIELGFQRAFWVAGDGEPGPPHLGLTILLSTAIGTLALWLCQRAFARMQDNFAQEL